MILSFKSRFIVYLELAAVLIVAVLFCAGSDSWLGFVGSSLYPQVFIGAVVIMVLSFIYKHWKLIVISSVCMLIAFLKIVPYLKLPIATSVATNANPIKIMVVNINNHNDLDDRFIEIAKQEKPEFLVVFEVTRKSDSVLLKLKKDFQEAIIATRESNLGYALFSNIPIAESSEHLVGVLKKPMLNVRLAGLGEGAQLVLVHLTPPLTPEMLREQKIELEDSIKLINNGARPALIVGDLNMTMWSANYKSFIRPLGLDNIRTNNGLCATWPSALSMFGVPIDHILYNPAAFRAISCKTIVIPGSDHLALIGTLLSR